MGKRPTISLGTGYKLSPDGKIVRDESAMEAKLDVSTRIQRRASKKVRVAKGNRLGKGG